MKSAGYNPVALWSGPRNVSTALMYSFGNREDCRILDEPLFGYFLNQTGVWRPSREEALTSMELDSVKILADMKRSFAQTFTFSKNMANHLEGLDYSVLDNFNNVILTRSPAPVLSSYRKQVKVPTSLDLCYEHQLKIIHHLRQENLPFLVISTKLKATNECYSNLFHYSFETFINYSLFE